MKKAIICFILVSILIAGCGKEKLVTGNAEIDWVDFIKVKGITYLADFETTGFDLDKGGVGKEYARVKYKVSDNVHNPSYEIQNGDAAFLEVGTKIYALNGYSPDCRLAVYVNEKVRIYDVDSNPDAIKGEDLLDIGGKVQYIDVIKEDENGLSEKYKIGAVDNVSKLVNYILDAEVDYNKQYTGGDRYFLYFYLTDDTRIRKCYFFDDNYLNPGIVLPGSYREEFMNSLE